LGNKDEDEYTFYIEDYNRRLITMKIMVTGSSGLVGKCLVKKLQELRDDVVEIDRNYGYDLTDRNCLDNFEKVDSIIHLAGRVFVLESYQDPFSYYYDNYVTTLNALEFARKNQAKFIYLSSYVYGIPKYFPINEKHPLSAINPYARTKLICEELCKGYNQDFSQNIIILRPFNIYGPGQSGNFLIPKIIAGIKQGKLELMDPYPKRDFVYVDDVVNAIIKCLFYPRSFAIFNVGSGKSYSVKEIVDILKNISGANADVTYSNKSRINEVNNVVCDYNSILENLDWRPQINIEQGLYRTFFNIID